MAIHGGGRQQLTLIGCLADSTQWADPSGAGSKNPSESQTKHSDGVLFRKKNNRQKAKSDIKNHNKHPWHYHPYSHARQKGESSPSHRSH
ncbi:hypothetical protein CEXT_723991 [Caerostris extrusa]|uniref:Uncharacterized protein n=1 Tax=Caerostris extrusa TaxID=172846 RepID=A0AAV4XDF2_CAEEX|nr:hypothetical protein CEXT_723991 [Caerostris extrusa]